MSDGAKAAVATWYNRGWKRLWLVLSMTVTKAGETVRPRISAKPPKPAPITTIRGRFVAFGGSIGALIAVMVHLG